MASRNHASQSGSGSSSAGRRQGSGPADEEQQRALALKEKLSADAKAIDVARDCPAWRCSFVEAIIVEVLELDFQIGVEIPVHAELDAVHDAAVNQVVIQIEARPARRQFPRAGTRGEAAVFRAHRPELRERPGDIGAAQPTEAAVIGAVFAGEEVGKLDISAVEAQSVAANAGDDGIVDPGEGPLRLQ